MRTRHSYVHSIRVLSYRSDGSAKTIRQICPKLVSKAEKGVRDKKVTHRVGMLLKCTTGFPKISTQVHEIVHYLIARGDRSDSIISSGYYDAQMYG